MSIFFSFKTYKKFSENMRSLMVLLTEKSGFKKQTNYKFHVAINLNYGTFLIYLIYNIFSPGSLKISKVVLTFL